MKFVKTHFSNTKTFVEWGICQSEVPRFEVVVGRLQNSQNFFPPYGRMIFWSTNFLKISDLVLRFFLHHHLQVQVAPYKSSQKFFLHLDGSMVWTRQNVSRCKRRIPNVRRHDFYRGQASLLAHLGEEITQNHWERARNVHCAQIRHAKKLDM